ncbi:hypothetical protein EYV94_27610 [Puteibacter caeruleilacunae]|nr:hypothetical protein EYV94_27610 [Puteibacter caeruleilacunae]
MNNINKDTRLKAFTLIEISVTILLSFIVIGMLYLALNIISKQVNSKRSKQIDDVALLKMALNQGFFDAAEISQEDIGLLSFRDSLQVRQFEFQDTLIIGVFKENIDTLYAGQYSWQFENLKDCNLIYKLVVEIPARPDTFTIICKKDYSLANRLNHKKISFEY